MTFRFLRNGIFLMACWSFPIVALAGEYQYIRIGSPKDVTTSPTAGTAMMGGGSDLDEAFRWLCAKGGGGDFLILRAHGDDDYNPYVQGLCKTNSVATLIVPDRAAAMNPGVADIIRHAEVVFVAGGDQSLYVRFWQGTPLQDAINAQVAAGRPIGGTSAGLAILGEYSYGALNDPDDSELHSKEALPNPYHRQVTVVRDFLSLPYLRDTLTDSHFAARDRMGRTLVFLARIMQDGWSKTPREVAIDEKSAVLVEADGKAQVVGRGKGAYFLLPVHPPEVCKDSVPLTFTGVTVYRLPSGGHFDLSSWKGDGGEGYSLSVERGVIRSTRAGGSIY
jgi:cyanophycinase